MDVGGRYNKAAILISLTPPPRRGEAVGAAEQTGLSSACFFGRRGSAHPLRNISRRLVITYERTTLISGVEE